MTPEQFIDALPARQRQVVDLWLDGVLCSSGNLSSLTGSITPSGIYKAIGAYDTTPTDIFIQLLV